MLLFIGLFSFLSNSTLAADLECSYLKSPGEFTKAYLEKISSLISSQKSTSEKLRVVLNAVHDKDPIDKNHLNLQVVDQIAKQYGSKLINPEALLKNVPKEQVELYREMHNRYSRHGIANLFFGPTAEDVIHFKMAFGCSHFSRAIFSLVKLAKIVPDDDIKYVAAVSVPDQEKICKSHKDDVMANGHQFLLIKIDGVWNYWNTSASALELLPAPDWKEWRSKNEIVQFPSLYKMPDRGRVAVRAIEEKPNQPLCDNTLERLRNIYRSGNPSDEICRK